MGSFVIITMRYFKATITVETISREGDKPEIKEQFLFCQTKNRLPGKARLKKVFDGCNRSDSTYLGGFWQEIDEQDYKAARSHIL